MKSKFTWASIIATLLVVITTFFVACKKDDMNEVVKYHGQVVYINTTTPFANLTVKVTNGSDTHCQTQTDGGGMFSLTVRVNEIDGNYYLLAGDETCIPKKVALGGYGQSEVDLGVIEVEGPAVPTVVTKPIQSVTANSALLGGEVKTDGRLTVTARGVCYGVSPYPTVDEKHTTDGEGLGEFTSTLKELEFKTIYYARAYATNKLGTAYGEQVKFTTEEGVALVVTDSVYRITAHAAKCKGHVMSDGGFPVTKRGTCWSKRPDPTVDDDCTDDGSGLGEFTSTIKNLMENTTYYVRTYATNSTKTTYGEQIIMTTLDGLAVVKTDSISAVTATGFTAYGTVVSDCDIPVTSRGFCYSTKQYPTIEDKAVTVSKGLGSFRNTISGLEYATTYYVRAYATNETATTYGDQIEVTTLSGLPTVTTDPVTNIGSVKATCGGEVTDDGSLTVTARGVCYGTEQHPTIEDAHTTDGKGKGKFTSSLKNLQDKTTYYVRAFATTDAGTAYGEQRTFKTENGIPVVVLNEVSEPSANSVSCIANVTGDGGVTVTERGLCYGVSQYPTNTDTHIAIGNGTGEFTGTLTGLAINTTYYVRAYAVNSIGVGYSEQKSFTTKNGLATVTTAEATTTATSINAGGDVTDNGGYAVTERGVCYSAANAEPTITDGKVLGGKGNGAFTVSITNLNANTNYYIRAYAVNENGTAYGNAIVVTTKDGVAAVSLGEVTNITALTAAATVTVSDAGSATLQSCGICWSTQPNPTLSDNKATAAGKQLNTPYTCNMSDLQPNTKYYVRAYASTDVATKYSDQKSFTTTIGLPILTTGTATSTATSFTCGGDVTDNGGYTVTERGICYSLTNSEPTILDTKVASGSGNGSFNVSATMLTPSMSYYVRAYATNMNGTAYGNTIVVTTKDGVATVTTGTVTNITALTATGQVTVTDAGGATLQSCGVCWSTTQNPTVSDNSAVAGGKAINTAYVCNMASLTPNTTYYVRAYATTDIATSYGKEVTFKTTIGLPTVTTGSTTAEATSISSYGQVTDNGGYNVTERGVCYSKTKVEPTIADFKVACGSGNGSFEATIANLEVSTLYYLRAYATNEVGTSYGRATSIETKSGKATVKLGDNIFNVTKNAASATVTVSNAGGATLQNCGICWSINQNPTITDNKTEATGKQLNTAYTCNMSSLSAGTTYYVRAYATTNIATVYSDAKTFTTPIDITGTVKNESGQAISSATVTFKQGSTAVKSVTTNSSGKFTTQLVTGSYNVEVTAQGYSKLAKEVYADSNPMELVMKQLGILTGKVYDDDNMPLANATVAVRSSSSSTTFTAVSGSDGSYRVENIPLGQTSSITCSLSNYKLTTTIPNRSIVSGANNSQDINMTIVDAAGCSNSGFYYECTNDGMCGSTVTNTFKLTNNRQKSVSWSLSGVPTKGLKFSSTSGTIAAKSSVTVTVTFTYPGPSVSGSVKTTLYNCYLNNQKWTHTYLWNWSTTELMSDCDARCMQTMSVLVGSSTFTQYYNLYQHVVWN